MTIRTFWLNLGWLVVLVVTVAVPLGLDAVGRLTYFTSLALWGIPILYLWPVFSIDHGGRHRAASAGLALGRRHDRRARHRSRLCARIPDVAVPGLQRACRAPVPMCGVCRPCGGRIPVEELLFYAMGPVAIVLVYACADELWLSRYNPKDDLLDLKLIQLSPRLVIVAAGAAVDGAGALARERNLSDLFCVHRRGRRCCRRCSCTGPSAT